MRMAEGGRGDDSELDNLRYPVPKKTAMQRKRKWFKEFKGNFNEVSWQPSTTKVPHNRFAEVTGGHNIAVLHFYASWNRYDVTMDQMLCEIADAYKDQIFVGSINTDDQQNWERCKELRILNLPAIANLEASKINAPLARASAKTEIANAAWTHERIRRDPFL